MKFEIEKKCSPPSDKSLFMSSLLLALDTLVNFLRMDPHDSAEHVSSSKVGNVANAPVEKFYTLFKFDKQYHSTNIQLKCNIDIALKLDYLIQVFQRPCNPSFDHQGCIPLCSTYTCFLIYMQSI